MAVLAVNQDNFEQEVLNSDKPVVADFWATWCGPCRMLSPLVEEMSETHPEIKFVKVNVDENTELVPAWRIIQTKKQPNDLSVYQHFVNCAEALGIPNVVPFLDRMIVLDYLILNEDRHLNNFGALRNADTLEWLGMAPIYDSGSSLGYDKTVPLMKDRDEVTCKPFKKHHDEQLKLVSSFNWIDFSALSDIREIITGVLSDEQAADYIDERRIQIICKLAEQRVQNLEAMAKVGARQTVTAEDDVKENIAADYKV